MARPLEEKLKEINITQAQVNSVLKTVYERCKKEKDSNRLLVPLEDYEERVCYYTAFPKTYIFYNVFKEQDVVNFKDDTPFDFSDRIILLKALKEFYVQQRSFKCENLYAIMKDLSPHCKIMTENEFRLKLHLLGFEYKKSLNYGFIIVENPEIRFERTLYLKKIKKLRNTSAEIYYIDERFVGNKQLFENPYIEDTNIPQTGRSEHLYYLISRNGYETGIFCPESITIEDYKKWITDIVATNLKPASVVVINCTSFHKQMLIGNTVSIYDSKLDMLKWLQDHNIPCSEKMLKAELFELIQKYPKQPMYEIDNYLKSYGHEVIHLPKHLHQLTPVEYLWKNVISNSCLRWNPNGTPVQLMKNLQKYLQTLPSKYWSDFEDTIIKQEYELLSLDEEIENLLDRHKMDVTNIVPRESFICHYCEDRA